MNKNQYSQDVHSCALSFLNEGYGPDDLQQSSRINEAVDCMKWIEETALNQKVLDFAIHSDAYGDIYLDEEAKERLEKNGHDVEMSTKAFHAMREDVEEVMNLMENLDIKLVNGYEIRWNPIWSQFVVSHEEIGAGISEHTTLHEAFEECMNG